MSTITEYEILDHGVWSDQEFQGVGVAFTRWDEVALGCGYTPAEALEDALEQLAEVGFTIDEGAIAPLPDAPAVEFGDEAHCFVSIRYKRPVAARAND